jgi:hypothetical protein
MGKELTPDTPLAQLTEDDRKMVDVTKMEEYTLIFFHIEHAVLRYWYKHPTLKDRDVLSTFKKLIKNFDNHKEGSLAGIISRSVKYELIRQRKEEKKVYTYGEVISCVRLLKKILKIHKAPNKRGYLHWVETFFEGKLPETEEEITEYIRQYESQ